MIAKEPIDSVCVIIGASHAGVNCATALRREGWEGQIILFDADPVMPYHKPPLSKAYLTSDDGIDKNLLKSVESYEKENIRLCLGVWVSAINPENQTITLADGSTQAYDKLVLATGARPIIPVIPGLDTATNVFPLRTAQNVTDIRHFMQNQTQKRVVVIGGGYIGLETAASLKKLGADVVVLERETRILARVTAPEMSTFFHDLHHSHGVEVLTNKNVTAIENNGESNSVICADGSRYVADMIIVGVGIFVNKELAEKAQLKIENGIVVDETSQTSQANVYAIGDCTYHFNPHYNRYIRLESVQNAVDQSKVAAAAICGKQPVYDSIPWFWSDQYDVKLQMVGLSQGYNQIVIRNEENPNSFSVWYFQDEHLLSVDAVNNAKAYVMGTKALKDRKLIDKEKLKDISLPLKLENILV
ncbi:FAD-dependent oxidoreductase [Flavobacterium sp. NG2]|uniref:NAD(P)/FAD-dependent oxidoreductase n=1 Tax=Flavobacterium sp. NG2 TaxID=3097547 RepID=UPI002A7F79C3|nr:FAD-dependent oxidoreductase [Flavobacterium sp. NG2]WPR73099.1 FAD-dependent oxidoreductase [Flavobacterium sp. NG2]